MQISTLQLVEKEPLAILVNFLMHPSGRHINLVGMDGEGNLMLFLIKYIAGWFF